MARNEIDDNASTASLVGIGIPAIVIALAAALYFFWPASDSVNRAEMTPPAAQQQQSAPKTNPQDVQVTPESEKKAPPAAEPKSEEMRDPRTDSQNAN